jgi:hypothetical protein
MAMCECEVCETCKARLAKGYSLLRDTEKDICRKIELYGKELALKASSLSTKYSQLALIQKSIREFKASKPDIARDVDCRNSER